MIILRIIIKEFIRNIRNFKANIMMVLFPIVLIIILGAAFSGVMDNAINLGDVKVLYAVDAATDSQFAVSFKDFLKQMSDEIGITFEKSSDISAGRSGVENHEYSAFVHITDDPLKINLYKNERADFSAELIENALYSYTKTFNAMSAIAVNNAAAFNLPELREYKGYVKIRALDRERQPGSTDYYAITMLTMILMYSSLTGFWSVREEMEQKTAARVLCAPVHDYELMAGKVAGCIIVTITQGLTVILFSKLILKAYWGEHILPVAILVLTYSIMTVSFGVAFSYLIKNSDAASGIFNTIIPLFVFLGGGYVPMSVLNGTIMTKIAFISPVRWINAALFQVIYESDFSIVPVSVIINVSLAVVFIVISALLAKRRSRAYA